MLAKRIAVALILLPIGLAAIIAGEPVFAAAITLTLAIAAWEYVRLLRAGGLKPAGALVVGGTVLFAAGRAINGFNSAPWIASILILSSMAYHVVDFERGSEGSATSFSATLGGFFYLGWIGSYLISLRDLPDGMWWFLLVLPSVWVADVGAYLFGHLFGRHPMAPRTSPNKTWEGYLGGILSGTAGGAALAAVWLALGGPDTGITVIKGAQLGLVLALLTPLGDLGESMIKRQVGAKDSGKLLPGHGGVFDRIDSWLWAGVIGYYLITWIFLPN